MLGASSTRIAKGDEVKSLSVSTCFPSQQQKQEQNSGNTITKQYKKLQYNVI
jgi:hypothetical protein